MITAIEQASALVEVVASLKALDEAIERRASEDELRVACLRWKSARGLAALRGCGASTPSATVDVELEKDLRIVATHYSAGNMAPSELVAQLENLVLAAKDVVRRGRR